ncbi:MAG TPA: sugar ABC transporter ATP-binding protein [Pirellulaceae bacterium]|nr:sugar ABC transporter ATP-binding protein [Pirellulaceae bacterium]
MSARTLTQATSNSCLLRVERISKQFPGVQALSGVSFSLRSQEVLGIVGENGAGKSTLMKILAGAQTPDSGEIYLGERPVKLHTSRQAIQQGIVLIHQELNLCGNLNVAQNIFLGREPRWGPWIKRRQMLRDATRHLKAVGLSISPVTPTDRLTVGRQQMVEIAKALAVDARVIIFDEPTSSLSQRETESLFGLIDELRQRGCGLIYISHRLGEICRLADRVLVLRDGYRVGELHGKEIQHDALVRMMVGRDVAQRFSRREHALGDEALAVEGLVTTAFPQQAVSFSVRAGEIVGVAGLVGAGRSELLQAIFGVGPPLGG